MEIWCEKRGEIGDCECFLEVMMGRRVCGDLKEDVEWRIGIWGRLRLFRDDFMDIGLVWIRVWFRLNW